MVLVTVYGLPADIDQDTVNQIHYRIRRRIAEMSELRFKEDDISVFFPLDLRNNRREKKIVVTIEIPLYGKGLAEEWYRGRIQTIVANFISNLLPDFDVDCKVKSPDNFKSCFCPKSLH